MVITQLAMLAIDIVHAVPVEGAHVATSFNLVGINGVILDI